MSRRIEKKEPTNLLPSVDSQLTAALERNQFITLVGAADRTRQPLELLRSKLAAQADTVIIDLAIPAGGLSSAEAAFQLIAQAVTAQTGVVFPREGMLPANLDLARNLQCLDKTKKYTVIIENIQHLLAQVVEGEDLLVFIRSLFNSRGVESDWLRFQFILVGENDPNDIRPSDSTRTPYNISQRFFFPR